MKTDLMPEQIAGCLGGGGVVMQITVEGRMTKARGSPGLMDTVIILIVAMASQVCAYICTYQIVLFKEVWFGLF